MSQKQTKQRHATFLEHFQQLAQQHGLPPELSQHVQNLHQTHGQHRSRRDQALKDYWAEQAERDPDLCGGDGFQANLALAQDVVRQFGDADLRQSLKRTGMCNNPALVRIFARIGHELKKIPPPKPPIPPEEASMRALYPTMFKD